MTRNFSLTASVLEVLDRVRPAPSLSAHCDGPCGVYDPASARIAAEAVKSMTQKLIDLGDANDLAAQNTRSRYITIKEEESEECKRQLLILWTDYFKPPHLEDYPELHTIFWNAAKQCSATKTSVDAAAADELMATVQKVHEIFWASKGRDVPWYTAS